jgi:multidrug resistance efflux pump
LLGEEMKTTADHVSQPLRTSKDAFSRSKARQLWFAAFLAVAAGGSLLGVTLSKPKVRPVPVLHFVSAPTMGGGMVAQIYVHTGQVVRKGELLASLDYGKALAALDNARAELENAIEQETGSNVAVALPATLSPISGAFEKKPVLIKTPASTKASARATSLPKVSLTPTAPKESTPASDLRVDDYERSIKQTRAEIPGLESSLSDAKSSAETAQAALVSAQAVADRTRSDKNKASTLLAEGVLSANEASKAEAYAAQAAGALQSARLRAAQAQAQVGEVQRMLDKAKETLAKSEAELPKAIAAAKKVNASSKVAATPPAISAAAQQDQPKYKLVLKGPISAPVPPAQPVKVDFTSPADIAARIKKAETALAEAQANCQKLCIYAPADGIVARVGVRVGQMVQPGVAAFVVQRP